MKSYDVSDEHSRRYDIYAYGLGWVYTTKIDHPKKLFYEKGHAFHRIFDGDEVTLAPAPGFIRDDSGDVIGFCRMSWIPKDCKNPCAF